MNKPTDALVAEYLGTDLKPPANLSKEDSAKFAQLLEVCHICGKWRRPCDLDTYFTCPECLEERWNARN